MYAGVGPGGATAEFELNGDVIPATSGTALPYSTKNTTTIWGGAGQVGVQYLLPCDLRFAICDLRFAICD